MEHGPFIVDLSIKMVIFHSDVAMLVYWRVYTIYGMLELY